MCGEPVQHDNLVEEDDYNDDLAIEQLPWMVSFGEFKGVNNWVHSCGGSLITPKYVKVSSHGTILAIYQFLQD